MELTEIAASSAATDRLLPILSFAVFANVPVFLSPPLNLLLGDGDLETRLGRGCEPANPLCSVTLMLFCRVRLGELDRTLFCKTVPGGPGDICGIRIGHLAGDSTPRSRILSGENETG